MKKIIIFFLLFITILHLKAQSDIEVKLPKRIGVTFQSINKEYETNKPFDKILETLGHLQLTYINEAFGKIKPSGYYDEKSKSFYSSYGEKIKALLPQDYIDSDTIRFICFIKPMDFYQKTFDFQLIKKDENTTIVKLIKANLDISKGDYQKSDTNTLKLIVPNSAEPTYSPDNIILESGNDKYAKWEEKAISNFEKIVFKFIK